ncbi:MAG: hypothetical protein HXS48_20120 [Theionarchaea archaeon]|nr:MAG: hypothetical protein AYK19_00465 [Theionarchaea archaeon DG-70-1]MBU7029254.1 hypothetical protein [Theionarchaea archaeon]
MIWKGGERANTAFKARGGSGLLWECEDIGWGGCLLRGILPQPPQIWIHMYYLKTEEIFRMALILLHY